MSVAFLKSSSQYAEAASPGYENDFTLSFWVYPTDFAPSSGTFGDYVTWRAASAARTFSVGVTNAGVLWAWWWRASGGTNPNAFFVSSLAPTLNAWNHVAFVHADAGDSRVLYLNGTAATLGKTSSGTSSNANALRLGRAIWSPNAYSSARLAEVAIWPGRLGTAEEASYLAGGGDALDLGLPGRYWPLRDNTDLTDWIGGSALTLSGSPTTAEHAPIWAPGQSFASPAGAQARPSSTSHGRIVAEREVYLGGADSGDAFVSGAARARAYASGADAGSVVC